jgi:hypothetical protein
MREDEMTEVREFRAAAAVRIRGHEYRLTGHGSISDSEGIVRGSYRHELPANDFEPLILQVVLVTGYPSVCRSTAEQNPFKCGDYHYARDVDFGTHGNIHYQAKCWTEATEVGLCLCSEFDVETALSLPPVGPATSVRESWTPSGSQIRSKFEIAWPMLDGSGELRATARSVYSPNLRAKPLAASFERAIRFSEVNAPPGELHLVQESWLEN